MDISLLPARIEDLKDICNKTNTPKFSAFLTAEETAVAVKVFKTSDRYCLFGGYEGAERVVVAALPDWCEQPQFPIKAITFSYRKCDNLSHRDFLGALMSLGIARETVGDILVETGRAVVFVLNDISKFVLTQIDKIGRVGIQITEGYIEPLPQMSKKQSFVSTVSSMRIDCVAAALCDASRNQISQKIQDGEVLINSICVTKPTVCVKAKDKITIRKMGKFDIVSCEEFSKKGRIILKYDKYV